MHGMEYGAAGEALDATAVAKLLERLARDIGDAVAEMVHMHHPALDAMLIDRRQCPVKRRQLVDGRSYVVKCSTCREMCGNRREDVAPVERITGRVRTPELRLVELYNVIRLIRRKRQR